MCSASTQIDRRGPAIDEDVVVWKVVGLGQSPHDMDADALVGEDQIAETKDRADIQNSVSAVEKATSERCRFQISAFSDDSGERWRGVQNHLGAAYIDLFVECCQLRFE